jgi:murein DD-endopeptidase MepM/ murein hydrolase activator NlpD
MPNPVEKPRVTQPWGKPNKRYKAGRHTGIDYGMPVGTPMLAVADGIVEAVFVDKSYGNVVKLKCVKDGVTYHILYCHLQKAKVKARQAVTVGQTIALSGNTGNSTGPHLHLETRIKPFRYGNDVACPFIEDPAVVYKAGVATPKTNKPKRLQLRLKPNLKNKVGKNDIQS